MAVVLAALLAARGAAAGHLVEPVDIEAAVDEGRRGREADGATLDAFLARPLTVETAQRMGLDVERLRRQAAHLSDGERHDLAVRAGALDADPVAGGVGTALLYTVGVLAAAFVLLLIIVVVGCAADDDCTFGG